MTVLPLFKIIITDEQINWIQVKKPPNIVLIVVDDLGYNDVSWHNPDVVTPNIDKLAKDGVILGKIFRNLFEWKDLQKVTN